ncbi:MAG: hypothetical protein ACTFAK_07390 [Candidatus Electronema sp. VV]
MSCVDAVSFHAVELKRHYQTAADHIDSYSSIKQNVELLTKHPGGGRAADQQLGSRPTL